MMKTNQFAVLRRLLTYTKPYRIYFIFAGLSALISVLLSLLIPVLIGKTVDEIIGPGQVNFTLIGEILIQMAIVIALSALFQWLMTFCTNKITFYTVRDLRLTAFQKLENVPLQYIDTSSHGDVIHSIVNDIDQISDGLLQSFSQLLTGLIAIIGTLVIMMTIQPNIASIVVILTPISIFVASFISKRTFHRFKEQSAIRGELSGYIEEMLGNQKIVTAFHHEDKAIEHFQEINARLHKCGIMAQFYSSMTNPSTRFVNGLVYAIVGLAGSLYVIKGAFSIGQLTCFLSYANQYTKPFNEISGVIAELQSAFASARRVFDLIDQPIEENDANLLEVVKCTGSIQINKVYFNYTPEVPLIEDLNLEVTAGQRIAIVGPTGCGKTTIINLLMRFYDVTSGTIHVSRFPIREMKRETLRSMYGMVLQDTWLFHGTVRDNISYGCAHASEEEIVAAAKAAYAHSFIKRLPHGYDTMISEEGENISQGQKQLLCIARIMLTKPPMLILDEATSNIDTRTEIRIQKAFQTLMEGRTSFIIAHRLSTIKDADIILVMDKGKIIEQGNHDSLIQLNGFYANLYHGQFET